MSIKTKTAEINYDERGFLRIDFLNNNEVFDEEEVQEQLNACVKIMDGKKAAILVDVRNSFHVPNKEAKKILAENKYKTAEAILINSLAHSLIGNFYIKLVNKSTQTPIKLFKNEKKAIEWLLANKK